MSITRMTMEERFWWYTANIGAAQNDCWEWRGTLDTGGYGAIRRTGRYNGKMKASRYSWELHYGAIPDGKHILHKCDNRCCVRPDHLFVGTHTDNMRDMTAKGRGKPGGRKQIA